MSNSLRFCITHKDGGPWTLSEWDPKGGWWFNRGEWRLLNHFDNEADAQACMRRLASPVTTRKYYDRHGGEDVGDGW